MGLEVGFFGFVILVIDIWAILKTVASRTSTGNKVLWIVLILVLPILGVVLWAIAGPKDSRS